MKPEDIIVEIKSYADKDFAKWSEPLLQVNEDGYGKDDKLLGVRVPILRKLSKKYSGLDLDDIKVLLRNEYHEIRSFSLMVLINIYRADKHKREQILKIYLDNADCINNWDLVDISAPNILGNYVFENRDCLKMLYKLSESDNLWEQRIAIVSTQYLIKHGFYEPTIKLSEKYLTHPHHLIHKAVGWMLRELGKANIEELYSFLDKYSDKMPRVMLRYSLERLDKDKRQYYMQKSGK